MTPRTRTPLHVQARIEARDTRLQALGYRDYATYLRSAAWATVKARYRESSLPQSCVLCDGDTVQLHHTTYERVGEERLTDLAPLCGECHQTVHALERRGELGLDFAGLADSARAEAYAERADAVRSGPRWDELHREDLTKRHVAGLNRQIRDLYRRYRRAGVDTRPVTARIQKAISEVHESLGASEATPLPYDPETAHAISRADAEVSEAQREALRKARGGKLGRLSNEARLRAERRAREAREQAAA